MTLCGGSEPVFRQSCILSSPSHPARGERERDKAHAPERHGRDERPRKRKREDDGKVAEKVVLLELVPAVEDDGRQEHVEEDGGLERDHVAHDVARGDAHYGADAHA